MKFLFASDSFKGSLSSVEIHGMLERAAGEIFPGCETVSVPMADGGEGTMDAVIAAAGGSFRTVEVAGPLLGWKGFQDGKAFGSAADEDGMQRKSVNMDSVRARYGILPGGAAIIEMAEASGLCLVPGERRDPRFTSTYGTGQLIRDALEQGARSITIAIGGSATNDGGMGAMAALGARFLDRNGQVLFGCGKDLGRVASLDLSGMYPAIGEAQFTVMCDVDNPLLGPDGATWTFGAQKGATPAIQEELEAGMRNYAEILRKTFFGRMQNSAKASERGGVSDAAGERECAQTLDSAERDFVDVPGAGAAGGLGAALRVFLGAEMKSGVETVLDLVGFDRLLEGVDCVITGEGRIDWQSAHGKVISGVAKHCAKGGIPVIAMVGGMGKDAEATYEAGISSIFTTSEGPATLSYALEHAPELYMSAARRMFRVLRIGAGVGGR